MNVGSLHNMTLEKFFSLISSSLLDKTEIIIPAQQYMHGKHPKQCLILNSLSIAFKTNMATSSWNDYSIFERTAATVCSILSLPYSPSLSNCRYKAIQHVLGILFPKTGYFDLRTLRHSPSKHLWTKCKMTQKNLQSNVQSKHHWSTPAITFTTSLKPFLKRWNRYG